MDKVFSTTNAQLKKSRARGLIISNGSRAKRILEMEIIIISLMAINLYFLINPMLAQTNSTSPVRNSKKSMLSIFLTVNYVICLSDISLNWKII